MGITVDDFLRLSASDSQMTWADCPGIFDEDTWVIDARGLSPWVERRSRATLKDGWRRGGKRAGNQPLERPDLRELYNLVRQNRSAICVGTVAGLERLLAGLIGVRDRWAHQQSVRLEDAHNALRNATKILRPIEAPEADAVAALTEDLL